MLPRSNVAAEEIRAAYLASTSAERVAQAIALSATASEVRAAALAAGVA